MPAEFAYPDALGPGNAWLQFFALIAAVFVLLLPLIREISRRGPMNWLDVVFAWACLIVAGCLPHMIESQALARLQSELQLEEGPIRQIWSTVIWSSARGIAGFAVFVHGCWLMSALMKSHKMLRTTAVYLLPITPFCFPSLGHPRHIHHRYACQSNMHRLGLALHNQMDKTGLLTPAVYGADTTPRSWRVELLPFLDAEYQRTGYNDALAWDAPPNDVLAKVRIDPLMCPANYRPRDFSGRYYTAYSGVVGPNTFFAADNRGRRVADVTDGTSTTIAFVEACGAQIVWTEPRDLRLEDIQIGVNLPGRQRGTSRGLISSCHPHSRGGHVTFVDGSVRLISVDADPKVLAALLTINGGETIPRDADKSR